MLQQGGLSQRADRDLLESDLPAKITDPKSVRYVITAAAK